MDLELRFPLFSFWLENHVIFVVFIPITFLMFDLGHSFSFLTLTRSSSLLVLGAPLRCSLVMFIFPIGSWCSCCLLLMFFFHIHSWCLWCSLLVAPFPYSLLVLIVFILNIHFPCSLLVFLVFVLGAFFFVRSWCSLCLFIIAFGACSWLFFFHVRS
jgi:hypothetical protein